ncbi:MAG: hypothetical protein HQ461_12820 [Deltaproteobacteria bacterium]|nr:hypothetical protein [Deltaproteobacteria bacterium]
MKAPLLLLAAAAITLVTGCASPQLHATREAGANALVNSPDGLVFGASPGVWPDGVASESGVVVFRVEVSNGSSRTVDLRRDDFELVTPSGATVRPIPPMQLFGERSTTDGGQQLAWAEEIADGEEEAGAQVVSAGHRRTTRRSSTTVWRSPSYPRWSSPYYSPYSSHYSYRPGVYYGPTYGPRTYTTPYGSYGRYDRSGSTRTEAPRPVTPVFGEGAVSGLAMTSSPAFASVLRDTMLRPQSALVGTLYFAAPSDQAGTYRLRWMPRHQMSAEAETTMELQFVGAE